MPSVRRRGSQVRALEGPAGVPGPSGAGLRDGPGAPVTKRPTLCHVLSGWRVGRQKARKRHSQTLNIDLSLPDRDGELGLASTHRARGPDPEARDRRRRLVVEPEAAGEAQTNAGGVNVKMTFSSACSIYNNERTASYSHAYTEVIPVTLAVEETVVRDIQRQYDSRNALIVQRSLDVG